MPAVVNSAETTSVADQFESLSRQWKAETALMSSTSAMVTHPAYLAVIALGPAVLPLLLRDMDRERTHWFEALQTISGEDPVPPDQWGDIPAMTETWLGWGRNRGLI